MMSKPKKNENQIALDLGTEGGGCMKQQIYKTLVRLHDDEGDDGHTVSEIAKLAKSDGLKAPLNKIRHTLANLAFDNHALVMVIAGKRRFFLGPIPYQGRHPQKNVTACVLLGLKTMASKIRKGLKIVGYTNAEIHEFLKATGYNFTKGQVSNATSRCQIRGLIGVTATKGQRGRRIDRFRWTHHPEAEAMVQGIDSTKPKRKALVTSHPAEVKPKALEAPVLTWEPKKPTGDAIETPKPRKTATAIVRQLRKLHDQAKHIIGKALISRDIPPNARNEAFAVVDAFDALLGKF
jgi:hypothetical protein